MLQQWDLPLTINVSLNGCEWKKLCRKTLAQDVFDRRWSLDGVKTLIKKQCEIFNFVDLCSRVGIVWLTTTRTRVSDATAVNFSVKCFNPLNSTSVGKHLQKVVCFIPFIYSRTFNNNVISSKEYVRRIQIILCCSNQHFISYIVSEIFIQIGYFF